MRRKRKFIYYCWKHSLQVAEIKKRKLFSRLYYFFDMMCFGFKYDVTTIDYMDLKYYEKNRDERKIEREPLILRKEYKKRVRKEQIMQSIYSSVKYQHPDKVRIRHRMYKKMFNFGEHCYIGFHVIIRCAHNIVSSKFICGNNVSIQRNTDLDYTGDLEIGNGVTIAEGVKILTHGHDSLGLRNESDIVEKKKKVYLSKLVIEDNVSIGVRSVIMMNVGRIGENSIISAGSVVRKRVPPNVIVAGNPAEIVAKFPEVKRNKKYHG